MSYNSPFYGGLNAIVTFYDNEWGSGRSGISNNILGIYPVLEWGYAEFYQSDLNNNTINVFGAAVGLYVNWTWWF